MPPPIWGRNRLPPNTAPWATADVGGSRPWTSALAAGIPEACALGLCAFDNKRFLLDDGVSSYAYGHWRATRVMRVRLREMTIPPLHTFTFEYMVHMPVPKWGPGKHLYIAYHDGVVCRPEEGVVFPYPPDKGIRIIK